MSTPTDQFNLQIATAAIAAGTFPDSGLPVAEILVLAGFLMIYLLEESMHTLLVKVVKLGECHINTVIMMMMAVMVGVTDDEAGKANHEGGLGGHHGHSHDNIVVPTEAGLQVRHVSRVLMASLLSRVTSHYYSQAAARGFLVVLALSIHDLFEGKRGETCHQKRGGDCLPCLLS